MNDKTGISDETRRLVRESVSDLVAADAAKAGALVALKNMSPHYISFSGEHPPNGLMKLFAVDDIENVDKKPIYVYLKQE